jgi:hypothetical protein
MSWGLSFLCIPCAAACADMIVIVNPREFMGFSGQTGLVLWGNIGCPGFPLS